MFKWTYLLDPPLVISCLGGTIMNIIYEWTSTSSQIFQKLHVVIKTWAFNWPKLRILSDGPVIFMTEWTLWLFLIVNLRSAV